MEDTILGIVLVGIVVVVVAKLWHVPHVERMMATLIGANFAVGPQRNRKYVKKMVKHEVKGRIQALCIKCNKEMIRYARAIRKNGTEYFETSCGCGFSVLVRVIRKEQEL